MDEMNDRVLSGGAAPGHGSGKGGHDPRTLGENTGLGPKGVREDMGTTGSHPLDDAKTNSESAIRR